MATLVNDAAAKKLREEENNLMALAKVVQQKKEELAAAEKALMDAEVTFEWNRLQALASSDEEATNLANALEEAIAAFDRSLAPPAEYEGSLEEYVQTDDCGDLSAVESTLDDILEEISEYRRSDVQNRLERSVAMLLLISSKFKRLVEGASEPSPARRRASNAAGSSSPQRDGGATTTAAVRSQALESHEYDEMTQSLLDEWADTLTDLATMGEDTALMLRLLTTKLGSPFDELSTRNA